MGDVLETSFEFVNIEESVDNIFFLKVLNSDFWITVILHFKEMLVWRTMAYNFCFLKCNKPRTVLLLLCTVGIQVCIQRNWVFATNSNFLTPIFFAFQCCIPLDITNHEFCVIIWFKFEISKVSAITDIGIRKF